MCRLLPFWRSTVDKITRDVGCVVVARHPLLVARSLARRNQLPIEHGLQLWQLHMKTLVRRIDESWRQVTVEYDQLLDDPEHQLHRVADALGLAHPAASAVREFGATFLDESLRHNKSGAMEALPPHVMETWNELRRLSLLA
jgi:hypothetical protein